MNILSCENLTIGYGADIIQRNVSFSINSGDYVCIVGENGAGKSTLLKTVLGLIPPVDGQVLISDDVRREGIGYLPQQGVVQRNFLTSVYEVILSGNQNRMKLFYSRDDKLKVHSLAGKFGISDLLYKRYSDLSGGQQQRVLLARALCVSDKLLILDEPVTGLDLDNQKLFYDMAKRINGDGTTIIMVSHSADVLERGISHVLLIKDTCVKLVTVSEFKGVSDVLSK